MSEKSTPIILKIFNIILFIFNCIINHFTIIIFSTLLLYFYIIMLIIFILSIFALIYCYKNEFHEFKFFYTIYIINSIICFYPMLISIISLSIS